MNAICSPCRANLIVLYDGECGLCHAGVQWIVRHDRAARFRFASLNSGAARLALARLRADPALVRDATTLVVIDGGRVHTHSDGVLVIAGALGLPWSFARAARVLPRTVRDRLYRWIARRRHRWFNSTQGCLVPSPELRARLLDADEPQRKAGSDEAARPDQVGTSCSSSRQACSGPRAAHSGSSSESEEES